MSPGDFTDRAIPLDQTLFYIFQMLGPLVGKGGCDVRVPQQSAATACHSETRQPVQHSVASLFWGCKAPHSQVWWGVFVPGGSRSPSWCVVRSSLFFVPPSHPHVSLIKNLSGYCHAAGDASTVNSKRHPVT